MLMFENGLLATFIPEFLMVFAYLFCLLVPGLKAEKQTANITPRIIQVSTVNSAVPSVYKVTQIHFYDHNLAIKPETKFPEYQLFEKLTVFTNHIVYPLDGSNQVHFSRPPPVI